MNPRYFLPFLTLLVCSQISNAQQELFLATQTDHVYAGNTNPALWPKSKRWFLGLPGLALDAGHSGSVTFNDFVKKEGDKRTINMDALISKLEAENNVTVAQRTETFLLGFKASKHLGVFLHHAIRTQVDLTYPKEAVQLLWQGNAQFIGDTVRINPNLHVAGFNELGIGANWQTDRWSVGGRLKYLSGIGLVHSERFNASVYTDPDIYQLTLGSDISLLSAGGIKSIDTTSTGFDVELVNFDRSKLLTKNTGFGLDLGASVKVTDKLIISASVLDLGASIKWKDELKQFDSQGSYTYEGVFFDGNTFLNDDGQVNVDAQLDTLRDIFQFTTTNATYTQKLPARIYAAANYLASDKLDFGVAVSTASQTFSQTQYGIGASVGYKPVKWLKLGTMISTNDRETVQLGSLLTVKLGPAHAYLVSDDILSAFTPKARPSVQLRYGFALVF